MLQKIRDNLQGVIAKVIIAIIAIPFAVFGIEAFFTGGVPDVARVGEQSITQPELEQAIELQRRRLMAQSPESVDPAQLEQSALRGPALEQLIERRLLGQVAERAGFRIGDAMIDRMILEDDSFHENGEFSQQRFQGILASNGMSPLYYRNLLREEALINQVLGGLGASDFATAAELGEVARITQQTLDVRYLTIPIDPAAVAPEVPAERVAAYFEANKGDFRTEETVGIDYLELRIEDLLEEVSEEDVAQEYQRRLAGFKAAEERKAAHIMISSLDDEKAKARLTEIRARIEAGEDFAALARDASEDVGSAQSGGELGFTSGDAFPPEFEAALAALAPGQVSQPVRTESGWHLVKLLEVRAQPAPELAEIRADIEADLARKAAKPRFLQRAEQLADLTFNSDGLAEAATELGLRVQSGPVFSRRGGEGLFADSRVIAAAFSEDVLKGQNSELVEISESQAVVVRVREHHPARQQELAEVEPQIRALLVEAIRREQAAARGEALVAELAAGRGMQDIASAAKLEWQVALGHQRGAGELPAELSEAVFTRPRAADGTSRGSLVLPAGDVVVFETSNFREGRLEELPAEQQALMRGLLGQSRGAAVVAHYRERLRATADVTVL